MEVLSFPVNAGGMDVRYTIRAAGGTTAAEAVVKAEAPEASLFLENVHLWDGRNDPYLYTLEASLLSGGETVDTVSVRFGVRSFDIDPEKGFILNGRPYPLRGVSRHQDRQGFGNALLPEHHREDVDLICELGANAVRLAHSSTTGISTTCATSGGLWSGRRYPISPGTCLPDGRIPFPS